MHHSSALRRLFAVLLAAALSLGGCFGGGSKGSSSGSSGGSPGGSPLGGSWSARDIGAVGQPGSSSQVGGTFTLAGSGTDIWDATDAFQYAFQPCAGDVEITARVLSLDNTDAWAKAGVMIRESLAADARFAMTVVTPGNGSTLQYRAQPAQGCSLSWGPGLATPCWVRLTRSGNAFTGAASPDGSTWTSIGPVEIAMGPNVYIGLCVTAHNNSAKASAVLDSVTIGTPSGGGGPPPPPPGGSLSLSTPAERTVYQRNNSNWAPVPIRGACSASVTRVDAKVSARAAGQGTNTDWTPIDAAPSGGAFHGSLNVSGGWYTLEVRAWVGDTVVATASRERVGVGEVFAVSGHSVAQGQDINIDGASDARANTIPIDNSSADHQTYLTTGDPQYLPSPTAFGQFGNGVAPSPFGSGTYFWAKFAEYVVQRQNVPVLIYNAGFGGTSLEHWAKSSQGIWFEHSFVNASIRMPYINLYNVLKTYIPVTGIRAILSDHGQNDWPETNADVILANYQTWVNQARVDLGFGQLAIVVNRATPYLDRPAVRNAQERMAQSANCFAGPDYDTMAPADRTDGVHLSAQGCWTAAGKWADALTTSFFSSSTPYLPPAP